MEFHQERSTLAQAGLDLTVVAALVVTLVLGAVLSMSATEEISFASPSGSFADNHSSKKRYTRFTRDSTLDTSTPIKARRPCVSHRPIVVISQPADQSQTRTELGALIAELDAEWSAQNRETCSQKWNSVA